MTKLFDIPRDVLKVICIFTSNRCVASLFNLGVTNKRLNDIVRSLSITKSLAKSVEYDDLLCKYRNKPIQNSRNGSNYTRMGGLLTSLAGCGSQDAYLTSTPQVTFFKSVYRRYTSFAVETPVVHSLTQASTASFRSSPHCFPNPKYSQLPNKVGNKPRRMGR